MGRHAVRLGAEWVLDKWASTLPSQTQSDAAEMAAIR